MNGSRRNVIPVNSSGLQSILPNESLALGLRPADDDRDLEDARDFDPARDFDLERVVTMSTKNSPLYYASYDNRKNININEKYFNEHI